MIDSRDTISIVDGKLSDTEEVPHAEIDELKEKYATGKYILYSSRNGNTYKLENPDFKYISDFWSVDTKRTWILIAIKDEKIADSVIANPEITVLFIDFPIMAHYELMNNCLDGSFFDSYREDYEYKLEEQPKQVDEYPFTVTKDESFVVGTQYAHLKCDTVEWSKQNHTLEQQKAICQFMINKYSMRDKGQDAEDIVKIKFYVDWLEEIVKK